MQIGQTIWAIDPCYDRSGENPRLTVGESYEVISISDDEIKIKNDFGREHYFTFENFDKYFSLTPPKEKELKMELNYLKALLPVVKEDLQTSYDIVGHESTAINRFVSKVEELINSQS